MDNTQPKRASRTCFKFVPLGTHREPVTDPRDYAVYVVIMAAVKIEREVLFGVLSDHGWPLEETDAAINRLVHLGVIDNVRNFQRHRPEYVSYEVPLKY
jgi:hypothetical protein